MSDNMVFIYQMNDKYLLILLEVNKINQSIKIELFLQVAPIVTRYQVIYKSV